MTARRSRNEEALIASAGSRMEPESQLNDEQWFLIADLFPEPAPSLEGGRPRCPVRDCVEGILWVLTTGARWKDLPRHFPSSTTCWRRHDEWSRSGIWETCWARLLGKLDRAGRINHEESFADGTFSSAKKGVIRLARRNAARVPRRWCSPTETACPLQL